jgi:hypothetical protein
LTVSHTTGSAGGERVSDGVEGVGGVDESDILPLIRPEKYGPVCAGRAFPHS